MKKELIEMGVILSEHLRNIPSNIEDVNWKEVHHNLYLTMIVEDKDYTVSLIKAVGDIPLHLHRKTAGVLKMLNSTLFPDIKFDSEIYIYDKWVKMHGDEIIILHSGEIHGFRNVDSNNPIYFLAVDSLPVDDKNDHLELK